MSKPKPGNLTDFESGGPPDEKHHFSKHHYEYETFSMHHSSWRHDA